MSAIATKTVTRAVTSSAVAATLTFTGVATTNWVNEVWTPVGIDANGVAKFRAPITGTQTLADAGVLTHSQTTPYGEVGKAVNKQLLTIPYNVIELGLTVRRSAKASLSIEMFNSMSTAQAQDFFNALISSIYALQADIVARSPMY